MEIVALRATRLAVDAASGGLVVAPALLRQFASRKTARSFTWMFTGRKPFANCAVHTMPAFNAAARHHALASRPSLAVENLMRRFLHMQHETGAEPSREEFLKRQEDVLEGADRLIRLPERRILSSDMIRHPSDAPAKRSASGGGEDAGRESIPFRRGRVLKVTDISSLAWCELQQYYARTSRRPPRTTAQMKSGVKYHKSLESEVRIEPDVSPRTKEDRGALKIWTTATALTSAVVTGRTREFWVVGFLDRLGPVTGIVDGLERTKTGDWILSDTKTTRRCRPLVYSGLDEKDTRTSNPAVVQLMIYKRLFDSLVNVAARNQGVRNAWISNVCGALGVHPDKPLSPSFVAEMQQQTALQAPGALSRDTVAGSPHSLAATSDSQSLSSDSGPTVVLPEPFSARLDTGLRGLLHRLLEAATLYAHTSEEMRIDYVTQSKTQPSEHWSETVIYDAEFLDEKLRKADEFWNMKRRPEGVDDRELGRCRACEYASFCYWRKERSEAPLRQYDASLPVWENAGACA